jgi:hypothetical protein
MDDATFLQQCGIEVDALWLAEMMNASGSEEAKRSLGLADVSVRADS